MLRATAGDWIVHIAGAIVANFAYLVDASDVRTVNALTKRSGGVDERYGDFSTMSSPDPGDENISILCNIEQAAIAGIGILIVSRLRGRAVQTYVPEFFLILGRFVLLRIRGQ